MIERGTAQSNSFFPFTFHLSPFTFHLSPLSKFQISTGLTFSTFQATNCTINLVCFCTKDKKKNNKRYEPSRIYIFNNIYIIIKIKIKIKTNLSMVYLVYLFIYKFYSTNDVLSSMYVVFYPGRKKTFILGLPVVQVSPGVHTHTCHVV